MGKLRIILLTDYKGFFSSKQKAQFYRGGLDLGKVASYLAKYGITTSVVSFSDLNTDIIDKQKTILLYTSSEDKHGYYKSFVEDIIFHLEQQGFKLIPSYACLQAHNNKIAMELMRERSGLEAIKTIRSQVFGTLEELMVHADKICYPAVIKPASGAKSRGVSKAINPDELIRAAKKISRTFILFHDIKELLRKIKYGSYYKRESFYRSKFIVQNLIKGLDNDWKVLVYGNRSYVLYRGNRKNDFRASGSGLFIFRKDLPEGLLDFALSVKQHFNVPNISLDIGFDGKTFHLIEFQFIYFGTTTLEKSPFFFKKVDSVWHCIEEKSDLEEIYVESIARYIHDNEL